MYFIRNLKMNWVQVLRKTANKVIFQSSTDVIFQNFSMRGLKLDI